MCDAAFLDYDNCSALTCGGCDITFCAYCHQGASEDSHSHVMHCAENPNQGSVDCTEEQYVIQQKAFKTIKLKNFMDTLDTDLREKVLKSPLVMEYFEVPKLHS